MKKKYLLSLLPYLKQFSLFLSFSRPAYRESKIHDPFKGSLRAVIHIKEERPVLTISHREVVKPGPIIGNAPEGNRSDDVSVFPEDPEDLIVFLLL